MAIDLKFDLRTADGREIEAMQRVIELRRKELGETTAQACKALAINILKSVRADTAVANENKADIYVTNVDSLFYPSFVKDGKFHKRILRAGPNGAIVEPKRVCWNTGNYVKGEVYHTYTVVDKIGEGETMQYLVVSKDENSAKKFAEDFHKRKVKKGKYLAKYALGLAMHQVHERENPSVGQIEQEAKMTGLKCVNSFVTENGFNSGDVNIHVEDRLDYATLALKSGEGYVQTAIQKALNSMTGYLRKRLEAKGIKDPIKIPFEELTK